MNAPPAAARTAAIIFAFLNLFGLMFFGDYYFTAEHRADLLIYALPIPALAVGAAAPSTWYGIRPFKVFAAALFAGAIVALCIALYRDLTLVNGADWGAAVLRSVEIGLLSLFLWTVATTGRRVSA